MISKRSREKFKTKLSLLPRNIQRLYKDGKCAECSVRVAKMDFAKILGKFTKVKIQYEANSTTKPKSNLVTSPTSRLKSNENGMVHINRRAYNTHPVKEGLKEKAKPTSSPRTLQKSSAVNKASNVLKENNIQKKTSAQKVKFVSKNFDNDGIISSFKRYGIVFTSPVKKIIDCPSTLLLSQMVPSLAKNLLPSDDWSIDYLPKELKDDKVYNRIAAELEDLMYNKNPESQLDDHYKSESTEKADEFPSILDILNESPVNSKEMSLNATNIETNDVEAMLLGKTNLKTDPEPSSMEVDNNADELADKSVFENPNSPSILDETLQKGIEEHLPSCLPVLDETKESPVLSATVKTHDTETTINNNNTNDANNGESKIPSLVTHVVFKKMQDGKCCKSVTCPKSLKYNIEIDGKSVELIGAPKIIYSLEDLQVLLQIVDECNLNSLYVLH